LKTSEDPKLSFIVPKRLEIKFWANQQTTFKGPAAQLEPKSAITAIHPRLALLFRESITEKPKSPWKTSNGENIFHNCYYKIQTSEGGKR
jgi:hypothetical protein